jgi:hypothetical protein
VCVCVCVCVCVFARALHAYISDTRMHVCKHMLQHTNTSMDDSYKPNQNQTSDQASSTSTYNPASASASYNPASASTSSTYSPTSEPPGRPASTLTGEAKDLVETLDRAAKLLKRAYCLFALVAKCVCTWAVCVCVCVYAWVLCILIMYMCLVMHVCGDLRAHHTCFTVMNHKIVTDVESLPPKGVHSLYMPRHCQKPQRSAKQERV